jgi:tellurite resistance protein TehA-like permease
VFPVGTLVTGTSQLAAHTGSDALVALALALFALLVAAWLTVAAGTARRALRIAWPVLRPGAPAPA